MATNPATLEIASELLTREVPTCTAHDTADAVRGRLVGVRFDSVRDIAVLAGDRLLGLVRIEDLFAAPHEATVGDVMDPDPPEIAPGADQEVAAWTAVRHRESSLAVVDREGRFVGLVPPHRLLGVLLQEHDEDMARLAGVLKGSKIAREATTEPVRRRLWHRLPWLLVGLAGALVAAVIVGGFESQLEENVLLAFFIPGIVYMADAVGTQTETLMIRGLSVGVPIRRVLSREVLTGTILGAVLALAFIAVGLPAWGDGEVVVAVAVALLAACTVATIVAISLPILFHRLGVDPAFGSGPLATVIQDILSILIYFLVAMAIVG